ncbi:hypothetical protein BN159_2880 [Streptomyces davaonensis JCM 4913]|uniref:Uncharacterized protein n=1 Tax=Streptomyces davaonensis (strain DSM 101723 / JCM 4913 / KCC S-0913 / 768) TaxID=1214101 RepID=K4R3I7_STRDJ|nr:hypothetical protein BN159_2880 [Streptomyces davaonensis JCM 4913]
MWGTAIDTGRMTFLLRTAHTADLTPAELAAVRALSDDAFDGDFADEDWEHCLGGMHALVEAVAVRADARRTGLGPDGVGA